MVTINYYLKGAISDKNVKELMRVKDSSLNTALNKPLQVYLTLSGMGKRIQIYTKKRISQYSWNKEKQEVDTRRNKINGNELNTWFRDFKAAVIEQTSKNENKGETTTIADLRALLDSITPIGAKKTQFSFHDYFKRFLIEHKTNEGHSKKGGTIKKYTSFYNHLTDFAEKKKMRLQIELIDCTFLNLYKDYLVKTLKLGDNTVAKYVKTAKTFILFYINAGLIKPFNYTAIKSIEREGEIYIIDLKQLMQLQSFDLQNKRLEQCRDVFCFQCWTGQRYSDIETLKFEDLKINSKGEKIWDFYAIKTGGNIKVPIVEYANHILNRYKNESQPLPVISNQKQNEYLKELGKKVSIGKNKIAGFDTKVKKVQFHDGKRSEEFVPFYEVLTTHVARKAYITISLIIGVPERVVKEVSGHKSEKDFRRYVNLANTYKDEMIRKSYSVQNIAKYI